jgi:hypothetical protein
MKKIYTSNFARNGNNPNAIAISSSVPEWFEGKRFLHLAPLYDMVGKIKRKDNNYDQRKYTRDYLDLLKNRKIDPKWLLHHLPDGAILLCYEAPNEFCHRRILAEWIERHTGVEIPEWKNEKELEQEKQSEMVDSILDF